MEYKELNIDDTSIVYNYPEICPGCGSDDIMFGQPAKGKLKIDEVMFQCNACKHIFVVKLEKIFRKIERMVFIVVTGLPGAILKISYSGPFDKLVEDLTEVFRQIPEFKDKEIILANYDDMIANAAVYQEYLDKAINEIKEDSKRKFISERGNMFVVKPSILEAIELGEIAEHAKIKCADFTNMTIQKK